MSSLLLANIPHDCEETDVRNWISQNGVRIVGLKLIADLVTRTSPSFAHVQLRNPAEADAVAKLLDGRKWKDHVLRVKPLKTAEPPQALRFRVGA
jgi:hypothetical protein